MNYAVITETTADLPQAIVDKYNILEVPAYINFPDTDESLKEKFDISKEQYMERIIKTNKHPFTSQCGLQEIFDAFDTATVMGAKEIMYVSTSSNISGFFNIANLAKKRYIQRGTEAKIIVHDSFQASLGIGVQAIKAVKLFEQGLPIEDVHKELIDFRDNKQHSTLTVKTLKYLQKSGRINRIQYAIGKILGITPCLEGTYEGNLEVFDRAKEYAEGIAKVIDRAYEYTKQKENLAAYIVEGRAKKGIDIAKAYLKKQYPEINIKGTELLSSSIYTHTGPGVVAIIVFNDFEY